MIRFLHNTLVTILGVFGLLLIVSSLSLGGFTARVVMSGSMEPTIGTGSVVFLFPHSTYAEDEVITFVANADAKMPTTHRIVLVNEDGSFTTKGDANDTYDFTTIEPEQVLGKVLFHIPYLGYLLDFAKKPLGFLLIIGIPVLYIIFEEVQHIIAIVREHRREKKEKSEEHNPEDV